MAHLTPGPISGPDETPAESESRGWRARRSLLLGVFLLALLMIPAAKPYLQSGYQVAHDRTTPFLRVEALADALTQGQIPPRWFPQFDGGYGSPYPSFYGMAFYYLPALFSAFGMHLGSSVELAAFLTIALSGLGMFFLARHLWGTPAGLLSAGLYMYAPYHLVDAFVRGAYSELAAFVWFPLIPLFMLLWRDTRQRRWIVGGGASVAGLIVTHNIMPLIFLPALPLFGLAVVLDAPDRMSWRQTLAGWTAMALLGCLLSAYFWLPILLDRAFIHSDYFLQFDYRGDFVGIGSLLTTARGHTLTTEIGVPILLSVAAGLGGIALHSKRERPRWIAAALLLLILGYAFMTNHRSDILWSRVKLLQFVQFPWRFLAPADFFLCLLAGFLAAAPRSIYWRWGLALAFPLFAIQIHSALIRIPQSVSQQEISGLSTCQEVWGTQDYRPAWSHAAFWHSTDPPEATAQAPVLPACQGHPELVSSASAEVTSYEVEASTFTVSYAAGAPSTLRIPIFYYPSWRVQVDGSPESVQIEPETGLMVMNIPPGSHVVEGTLGLTSAQRAGNVLSVLGILATIVVVAGLGRPWNLRRHDA